MQCALNLKYWFGSFGVRTLRHAFKSGIFSRENVFRFLEDNLRVKIEITANVDVN